MAECCTTLTACSNHSSMISWGTLSKLSERFFSVTVGGRSSVHRCGWWQFVPFVPCSTFKWCDEKCQNNTQLRLLQHHRAEPYHPMTAKIISRLQPATHSTSTSNPIGTMSTLTFNFMGFSLTSSGYLDATASGTSFFPGVWVNLLRTRRLSKETTCCNWLDYYTLLCTVQRCAVVQVYYTIYIRHGDHGTSIDETVRKSCRANGMRSAQVRKRGWSVCTTRGKIMARVKRDWSTEGRQV